MKLTEANKRTACGDAPPWPEVTTGSKAARENRESMQAFVASVRAARAAFEAFAAAWRAAQPKPGALVRLNPKLLS